MTQPTAETATTTRRLNLAVVLLVSPVVIALVLTIVGVIFHIVPILSFAGLLLFSICFILFIFADSLSVMANGIVNRFGAYRQYFDQTPIALHLFSAIELVAKIPRKFTLIIRGILLASSFWIVGFYVGLCISPVAWLSGKIKIRLVKSILSLFAAGADTVRGKSIQAPGFFAMSLAVYGAFSLMKNFTVLLAGLSGESEQRAVAEFFSSPLWFLDPSTIASMGHLSVQIGILASVVCFLVLPISFICGGFDLMAKGSKDQKCLAVGICFYALWLGSWGVYFSYLFVKIVIGR